MLHVTGVSKKFGKAVKLEKVSLVVKAATIHAVIGFNGSGKTTLLDIISGFQKADAGKIIFKKRRIENLRPWEIAKAGIARTFQIPRVFRSLSVLENLELAGRGSSRSALDVLEFLGIKEEKDKAAGVLPFAQQKLVELGKALMLESELILLDEPFSGVNEAAKRRFMEIMKELRASGKTLIVAEQELYPVAEIAEQVSVLSCGKKVAEGTADEIKVNPKVMESYDF